MKDRLKILSKKLLRIAEQKSQAKEKLKTQEKMDCRSSTVDSQELIESGGLNAQQSETCDLQAGTARHIILMNIVGESKYNEILCVSHEIKEIRRKSGVWTKFSRSCLQTEQRRLSIGSYEEERTPASKALPAPIFDIYFRIRLVDAMRVVDARTSRQLKDCPEPCACVVQRMDWDTLLEDAKLKLRAFRKFERENVTAEDDLSFSCSSGLCSLSISRNISI